MNQQLIKQVKEGTHYIENNFSEGSMHALCTVFDQFNFDYYWVDMSGKYLWLISEGWQSSNAIPYGLTPILLCDFFDNKRALDEKLKDSMDKFMDNTPSPTP